jgi:hypothetical protein
MTLVNTRLLELFRAHGIEAVANDGWLEFAGRALRTQAAVVKETPHPNALNVQLDVRFEVLPGLTIIESFAGLGAEREVSVADGFRNFTLNSFHVLLAAFLNPGDPQVAEEAWVVGGRPAHAVIGNICGRGSPPGGVPPNGWFPGFEQRLKNSNLRPGTHWIRVYYAQMQGKALACEVLLDNVTWEEMQSALAADFWPSADEFYSARLFLVVRIQRDADVSPETAVEWLSDIVAARQEFTDDDIYAVLADAGVSDRLADRAFKFTQIAWGRALLDGLGVRFPPEYFWLNGRGEVVESGLLADDPCFAAASRLTPQYAGSPGFMRLAAASADVNAVNNALNAGSDPKNLATSPAFLFLEAPTADGLKRAQETIHRELARLSGQYIP